MDKTYKIYSYLDNLIDAYAEPVSRVDGLLRNPKDIIRTVEFYSNNQYLSGNKDSLGREKPFFNVCNYRVTVAKTATDLDVKDIRYEPDALKDSVPAMLINHELYKYLKESNFSLTLNEMGITRPKYGGVLIKKCNEDGKLKIDVMEWTNVDFDPSDVLGGAIIETFHLQPSELAEKYGTWDEDQIKEFMKAHAKAYKNKPQKYKVQEVSGFFPESYYPDNAENEENNMTYKRMCFYLGIVNKKKFMLYYEYEKENKYKYLSWEKIGNSLGRGVVEDGFESQVWQNDAMISYKNIMDLASKIILTTDSQKVSGNIITGMDTGHILELEPNRTMSVLNLMPNSIPAVEKLIELWNSQYDRVASTFDANTGEAPTAGTPYSQTALLNQVANSPFEYRREEWGIFLNEVLNDWMLPYLKKQIKKEHYLTSEFSPEELDYIDDSIVSYETNKNIFQMVLNDQEVTPQIQSAMMEGVRAELGKSGRKREIKIPEGFLDVEGKITANITGELKNKAAILQSLDNILKTIVSTFNPNTGQYAALQDPTLSKVFGQIVEMAGVPLTSSDFKASQTAPTQTADLSVVAPATPVAA